MYQDFIAVGRISGAHGIKGEIKIFPLTDDLQRFCDLDYFICENKRYTIEAVRFHQAQVLAVVKEIKDRTEAEKFKGKLIQVERADAVTLEEGEYFVEELKGLRVYDTSSERVCKLKDIMQTGAVDVLVFDCDGKELMLPYLKKYVSEVNIAEGYMKADLSNGIWA